MLKEKKWDKSFEEEILKDWEKDWEKLYGFSNQKKLRLDELYSIDTPPPYANAPIHIGQASAYIWKDFFVRYQRMKGKKVLFPLGIDRNGLPIEIAAEKKFGISAHEIPREKFLEYCRKILKEASDISTKDFKRLGITYNSYEKGKNAWNVYYTDDEEYRALTQASFIYLYKKNLIYEDVKISNYCPRCRTTIADAEIAYEEKPTYFNYVKFKVKETNEEITVATTRPELLGACKAILFNPEDKRYKHLEGKHAVIPLYEREIKIMAHPIAEVEKGTGLVMMCSFGDYMDILFFREQKLDPLVLINKEGKMNEHSGFLAGLKIKEAREKITKELEEKGFIEKREKTTHKTPVCERCKEDLEFIEMKEFYLKQMDFLKDLRKLQKEIRFFDEKSRNILENWIDSVSMDWAISRRRFYATEIPIWYCKKCNHTIIPEQKKDEIKYYQPWKEKPPVDKCPKCGSKEFKGEQRVFDTWFDSSISVFFLASRLAKTTDFEKIKEYLPFTLRPQGKEIIRTWLYYTLLRVFQLTGKKAFENVWVNYHILVKKGEKMSKSKGEKIEPSKIIKKFGAEAFRLWSAVEGNLHKTDFIISEKKIAAEEKFLIKLWNISKFISKFEWKEVEKFDEKNLVETDKWFLAELEKVRKKIDVSFSTYNVYRATTELRHFAWEYFASHYLEMVKKRAYNTENKFGKNDCLSAKYALHKSLQTILKMLYPVIPFITYKIYKEIYGKNICLEKFPEKIGVESKIKAGLEEVSQFNSKVWNMKKEKGVSLKEGISNIEIPENLRFMEKDLREMHNLS